MGYYAKFIDWFSAVETQLPMVRLLAWHDGQLYGPPFSAAKASVLKSQGKPMHLHPVELVDGKWAQCGPGERFIPGEGYVAVDESQARQNAEVPRMAAGFSLIEMLIVVAIMVAILTIVAPSLTRMMESARVDAATSTAASAVTTARAYSQIQPSIQIGEYHGSAAIFTPQNEIRIARHYGSARHPDGSLLSLTDHAGYRDMADEPYVRIAPNVGIVGISRAQTGPNTSEVALIPTPFAVRFTRSGMLMPAHADNPAHQQLVFYDHEYTGEHDVNTMRHVGYNPADYNPEVVGVDGLLSDDERYILPYGRLDSVVGVYVFSMSDLQRAGYSLEITNPTTLSIDSGAAEWIFSNGTPVFFNRMTGGEVK